MELPVLPFKIPEITLPFDVPVLMHPPIDHLVIALPIVVLLLEIVNLFTRKKAIGVASFFLLGLTVVVAIAAYYTGTVDGKEAFDTLSQAGQAELKVHKLLGTYLMLASMVVLAFKLFSAIIKVGLMKFLYFLMLMLFVAGIIKQGKDGGELVYKYGANVERVADMDSEIFDLKEEIDELKEATTSSKVEEKATEVKEAVSKTADDVAKKASEAVENVNANTAEAVEAVKEKGADMMENVQSVAEKAEESVAKAVTPETTESETMEAVSETAPTETTAPAVESNISAE